MNGGGCGRWVCYELYVVFVGVKWGICEGHMGIIWESHDQHVGFTWGSHGDHILCMEDILRLILSNIFPDSSFLRITKVSKAKANTP